MNFTIDFMAHRHIATAMSGLLLIASVVAFIWLGINRGLDFTGGVLVELAFERPVDTVNVRNLLATEGFGNALVQSTGSETEVQIRVPPVPGVDQSTVGDRIQEALVQSIGSVDLRRSEFVGPTVGEELTEDGGLALLVALGLVLVYIMFRFTGKFAIGAVAALMHDVVIVVGLFCMFGWTFNLPELAALLAVIGYSLNDTIVVSDRIRENFRTVRNRNAIDIINRSLNQMLGRTLVTSLTTLLVLLALLIAGGEQIAGFATALTIGVVIGTYSSIYVAANLLLMLNVTSEDLKLPVKEGEGSTV
ncbi:MAG: protein translocase subunit SecF [Gammaproteobacteria bacterium]|nr:protein translocase subunit SecF [Gammaproteobacteria bacterium]